MDEQSVYVRGIIRIGMFALSACLMGWALMPEQRGVFAGLALGIIVSLINISYLSAKIKQLGDLVVSDQKRRFNLGFLTRAAMAILAVMIASKLEEVNMYATVGGLFFAQGATLLWGFMGVFKKRS